MSIELVRKLHAEVYRLSEAYEQHPEENFNSYEVGSLFEEAEKFLDTDTHQDLIIKAAKAHRDLPNRLRFLRKTYSTTYAMNNPVKVKQVDSYNKAMDDIIFLIEGEL